MLPVHSNFKKKHYSGLFKEGHVIYREYGGVAIKQHHLKNSHQQAVAATVNIVMELPVVYTYNSRSLEIN